MSAILLLKDSEVKVAGLIFIPQAFVKNLGSLWHFVAWVSSSINFGIKYIFL